MNNQRIAMALIFPFLAVFIIAAYLGLIGGLFIFLHGNTEFKQWSVIIVGVALTLGVPTFAYLLERKTESK